MPKTPHVMAYFYGSPWAILPAKFRELESVLFRRNLPGNLQLEDLFKPPAKREEPKAEEFGGVVSQNSGNGYLLIGSAAYIRVHGTISARPSIFEEYSGGTSHEAVGNATTAALADGKVESIVYDIDSPGGVVHGMSENGDKVFAARKSKPTYGIANYVAASAAYWYLSQCQETYVTPTGEVGCVGVLMGNCDETKALEAGGVRVDLVSNDSSPFKSEGYPYVPVTAERIGDLKATCNYYASMFVAAIAKGRGVRAAKIEKDFGQGRCLTAEPAVAAGLVDRIGTLDAILQTVTKSKSRGSRRAVAARMAELGLPTRPR